MAKVKIRDNALWLNHIEGDAPLRERLQSMKPGQIVDLEVDGVVGRWERMKNGRDGRPTSGLKPIEAMRDVWKHMQAQRGRIVELRPVRTADSYLAELPSLLNEWDSPEDEEAYRDL